MRMLFFPLLILLAGCNIISTAAPAEPARITVVPGSPVYPATPTPTDAGLDAGLEDGGEGIGNGEAEATPTPQPPTMPPSATPSLPSATPVPSPSVTPVPPNPQPPTPGPRPPALVYGLPIGLPGQVPGDGFFIRHGYAVENTWFNPGYWHAGEDWYLLEGDTAGALVYAISSGEVVYVGANYPGRVVIVRHDDGLYSMYGHLDPAVPVQNGQRVARGDVLGTVLRRSDSVPNHLHFEVRTFLISPPVNGATPRYGFRCGVNCPPGPGYWPIAAPDHPSDMGWRNPLHVINGRLLAGNQQAAAGRVVVVQQPAADTATLWSQPPRPEAQPAALADIALQPGTSYELLDRWAGPEDSRETSAQGYSVWYHVRAADGQEGWLQASLPTSFETGSDGRPATVRLNLIPAPGE